MDALPTEPTPELHLLGISFRTASETVREGLAFSPSQTADLLARAREALPGVEAVVLSTCNRTEFYLSGLPEERLVPGWHALLRALRPGAPALDEACSRYALRGAEAFRHLLRVVCGLDSALLGDGQVHGQVRRAVSLAQEAGTLGAVLSPATATALRVGRRARAETAIGKGAPGVGGAVAAAVTARGTEPDAPVLVLGSGAAVRAVTRSLVKAGHRRLVVCARNGAAAAQVAAEVGATTAPWEARAQAVREAAVVVVGTAADVPVLAGPLPQGRTRLVVDAGFPRQVADDVARPGVEVVSLLALTQAGDAAAAERQAAVPAVEALVAEHVATWQLARDRAPVERAIAELHAEAALLTREAAARIAHEAGVDAGRVEQVLGRQVRRMLHGHVTRLRALDTQGAS